MSQADQLGFQLGRQIGAGVIHGDKDQRERESVLNDFKSGRRPVMIATDVAARGIDVKDVKAVINYDFPGKPRPLYSSSLRSYGRPSYGIHAMAYVVMAYIVMAHMTRISHDFPGKPQRLAAAVIHRS